MKARHLLLGALLAAGCQGRSLVGASLEPAMLAGHTGEGTGLAWGSGIALTLGEEGPGQVGRYAPLDLRVAYVKSFDGKKDATLWSMSIWRGEVLPARSYLGYDFGVTVYDAAGRRAACGVGMGVRWLPVFRKFGADGRGSFGVALKAGGWLGTDGSDLVLGGDGSAGVWIGYGELPML